MAQCVRAVGCASGVQAPWQSLVWRAGAAHTVFDASVRESLIYAAITWAWIDRANACDERRRVPLPVVVRDVGAQALYRS